MSVLFEDKWQNVLVLNSVSLLLFGGEFYLVWLLI